jgi:UvrB/uvrC motif
VHSCPRVSMNSTVPLQERVLRLERALSLAVSQERFQDAATLRDALAAVRRADPSLSARDALQEAVAREDFGAAARLRDEIATLTELLSRQAGLAGWQSPGEIAVRPPIPRRVDRIVVLRSRQDQPGRLRVATISRDGSLELPLEPPREEPQSLPKAYQPRIYLQPCFSPSGDFICMTEIAFKVLGTEGNARVVSMADSTHRVVVMNAFDGTVVKSVPVRKPPFFYYWSPCGTRISMLYNGSTSLSALPTVSMSVIQVVAPASGSPDSLLSGDLDAVVGPVVSGHPLLYEFCPRDSNRIVAHIGDRSEVVVASLRPGEPKKVLAHNAGSFGTPQWHPVAGSNGREVVLFVEAAENSKSSSPSMTGVAQPRILRTEGLSDLKRPSVDDEIAEELEENDGNSSDNVAGSDTPPDFWSTISVSYPAASASNFVKILEDLVKRGVRSLGVPIPEQSSQTESISGGKRDASVSSSDLKKSRTDHETEPDKGLDNSNKRLKSIPWGKADKKAANLFMCDVDNPKIRRCLCSCNGVVSFKLSPDGRKLALLVNNPESGEEELSICEGDFSPDSVTDPSYSLSSSNIRTLQVENEVSKPDVILSTPDSKVLAFFWSPDASKLLFLTSMKRSAAGAARWSTFDTCSNRLARYSVFVLSSMAAHSMSFFCAFANSMTPWSPDSDAFCYAGRPLSPEEEKTDAGDDSTSQANAAMLLTALMLQKKKMVESAKGLPFSAFVQNVACVEESTRESLLSNSKMQIEPPRVVLENVELASWSQC